MKAPGRNKKLEMEQQGSHSEQGKGTPWDIQQLSSSTLLTPSCSIAGCPAFLAKMLRLSLATLLVLVLGVSPGAAFPHDAPGNGCRPSKYQHIPPKQQQALSNMRHEVMKDHKCNTKLFHRKWNAVNLPMSDRVLLVAAELNLTIAMLELPASPSFAEARRQPLEFFRNAREDVLGCVDPGLQPSGKLRRWLHRLQEALRTESTACLRATTIPFVMQVQDNLRCWALQDKCRAAGPARR
ncbi:interferon lambda-3-like [Passer domesticus]|uniref:interferon lambda-3-like n=1 Tax=Passer domesticus TaxID=48849 RepID=UPI0030FF3E2C